MTQGGMPMETYARCFICDDCKKEYDLRAPLTTCPECGGLLEVRYDLPAMKRGIRKVAGCEKEHSIWRYRQFFPQMEDASIVSLGEGCTPLTRSVHLGPALGLKQLYFKNDTMMPTGSFKDRGFSLAVSYARDLGIQRGFTYSSGNAGASFAAYASRSGFNALVCVEYIANDTKKAMIHIYGAKTAVLEFDCFEQIASMLDKASRHLGLYQFVNFINPIRHEAMKTYAYEIFEDLGRAPDAMFHPVGTGGGLWGAYKGYQELYALGMTDRIPRMYCVQPEATAHFQKAFQKGALTAAPYGDVTRTIAQSIASDSPLKGGRRILRALYDSQGSALGVTEDEILAAMRDLAREGIAAEPSSAASVAAVKRAVAEGTLHSDDTVVCVITGSALKQPDAVLAASGLPTKTIHADYQALKQLLERSGL